MSVVGIDFGNEKCVISIAKNRGIDVLQNEVGHRATPSMIGFKDSQRFLGNDALPQYLSNATNTCKYMKRLVGLSPDSPEVITEKNFISAGLTKDATGRLVNVVKYEGKEIQLLPEQLIGALLAKCKIIAEKGQGAAVHDCVIGCPSFWSDGQRRSLLEAARIAGLRPLRVMNETTAVALSYGILRPIEEPRTVLFVDVGECSTTATLVDFKKGALSVRATASNRHAGGRDFDEVLFRHFTDYIKKTYKLDVTTDVKAIRKLSKECNRIKNTLSANTKVPMTVEYLMNDTDVKGMIERPEFEQLALPVLEQIMIPIRQVIGETGIDLKDVFAFECVGGAIRIPCVKTALRELFQRDISCTCDGEESVARGCALQCAMLSPSFKVREFEVHDISPFPIEVSWGPVPGLDGKTEVDSTSSLFNKYNPIPSIKMISFKERTQPFQLIAKYSEAADLPPHTDRLISRFVISGMPATDAEKKAAKVKVKVKLNLHGILDVHSAQLLQEVKKDDAVAGPDSPAAVSAMDTSADPEAHEEQKDDKQNDKSEDKKDNKKEDKRDDKKAEKKDDTKKKPEVDRVTLQVEKHILGALPRQLVTAMEEKEAYMSSQDRQIEETSLARNTLEAYVLEMRNKLDDELKDYDKASTVESFKDLLQQTEDWLYDEPDAQKSAYKSKLADVKKIGDPIENRYKEEEGRAEAIEHLEKVIKDWSAHAVTNEEAYKHIEPVDREKIVAECAKASSWLVSQKERQSTLGKDVDPVLTIANLKAKAKDVAAFCKPIMSKPKPAPPKPAEEKKEEKKPEPSTGEAPENAKTADDDQKMGASS